jgi:hypothetical protein
MRILILRNRLKNSQVVTDGLEKAKKLAKEQAKLDLIFTHVSINRDFTIVPFDNPSTSGYMVDPNEILGYEQNHGDHDAVCLIFNPEGMTPMPTNPTDCGEAIQIPSNWFGNDVDTFVLYFLHELCHEKFWKHSMPDITHSFYTSKFAQQPNGMVSYYLYLLSQFPPERPVVVIKRQYGVVQTLGTLTTAGFTCKTLELRWLENKRNVSCIPEGTYEVDRTFSMKFGRYVYRLKNVKERDGILIHPANFVYQLNGCIALGTYFKDINSDGVIDIANSKKAVDAFEKHMNYKPFTLVINH